MNTVSEIVNLIPHLKMVHEDLVLVQHYLEHNPPAKDLDPTLVDRVTHALGHLEEILGIEQIARGER